MKYNLNENKSKKYMVIKMMKNIYEKFKMKF